MVVQGPKFREARFAKVHGGWPLVGALVLLAALVPTLAGAQFLGTGEDDDLRSREIRTRRNRDRNAVKEWVRRLKDEKAENRLEAITKLGDSKDPKVIDPLIEATFDPDVRVKVKAVDYLGDLRATDSITVLSQQLFLRDVHPGVKHKVLVALGKIGDPRAGKSIAEFMRRDLHPTLQGSAIFALADAGGPDLIPSLQRVAEETDDPRIKLLTALAVSEIRRRATPAAVVVEPTYLKMERLQAEAKKSHH